MIVPSLKKIAAVSLVTVFTVLWISGLVAGLTAGACQNPIYHGKKKQRYCSITILAGSILSKNDPRRAILYLERGIAFSELGQADKSIADFRRALDLAARGDKARSPGQTIFYDYTGALKQRMAGEEPDALSQASFTKALTRGG